MWSQLNKQRVKTQKRSKTYKLKETTFSTLTCIEVEVRHTDISFVFGQGVIETVQSSFPVRDLRHPHTTYLNFFSMMVTLEMSVWPDFWSSDVTEVYCFETHYKISNISKRVSFDFFVVHESKYWGLLLFNFFWHWSTTFQRSGSVTILLRIGRFQ